MMKKIITNTVLVLAVAMVGAVGLHAQPASASSYCTSYMYGYGGSGQCVKNIQTLLNSYKIRLVLDWQNLAMDGSFGRLTKASVQRLQSVTYGAGGGYGYALNPDGIVGPKTWRKLCTLVNSGTGNYVNDWRDRAAYNDANCAVYGGAFRF